ncbi:MAG: UDP-4-amino-4,6-dideoxy-N-acetyl-beta-L-altrosamine transaminase [Bacteroidetes bacterium]|nr:UDP-4-amino-4,6-dideoxy-N-acetyl-beta-L-altrosamine transaminase [Bacteroidota bacterium]
MSSFHIPYGRQNITDEDIKAVNEVLQGDFLTQGPKIAELEKAFAAYTGSRYAVAVSNGTAALHLCAMALDYNESSRVITSPITFAASANCVRYCGGEVWFADIDPDTYTLSVEATRHLLASKPAGFFSGIIPVDFAGLPVDLEAFRKLADEYGCSIIEDACHAPGGSFINSAGKSVSCGNGDYAELAIFSFHPVKHIAAGEGGMITTNDESLYRKLLVLRTHGITKDENLLIDNHGGWYYEMQELGYNYRITDFQAALALSQLDRADEGIRRRREIAARYDEAFKNSNIVTPYVPETAHHAWHLYVIQVADRKGLYDHLRSKGIFAQVHYIPVHTMPYYRNLGYKKGDYPIAEAYYERCLSLPMFPTLTTEEQGFVIQEVLAFQNAG